MNSIDGNDYVEYLEECKHYEGYKWYLEYRSKNNLDAYLECSEATYNDTQPPTGCSSYDNAVEMFEDLDFGLDW